MASAWQIAVAGSAGKTMQPVLPALRTWQDLSNQSCAAKRSKRHCCCLVGTAGVLPGCASGFSLLSPAAAAAWAAAGSCDSAATVGPCSDSSPAGQSTARSACCVACCALPSSAIAASCSEPSSDRAPAWRCPPSLVLRGPPASKQQAAQVIAIWALQEAFCQGAEKTGAQPHPSAHALRTKWGRPVVWRLRPEQGAGGAALARRSNLLRKLGLPPACIQSSSWQPSS
jgi:hypothetical protein